MEEIQSGGDMIPHRSNTLTFNPSEKIYAPGGGLVRHGEEFVPFSLEEQKAILRKKKKKNVSNSILLGKKKFTYTRLLKKLVFCP